MESPPHRRIRLTVQYDGSEFFGWQLQPRKRTVQGELERVLTRLFARPARVLGSGRTDRGVHAMGQVASVDAPPRWEPDALRRSMNALLSHDVWIQDASLAARRFHPRYDAVSRSYFYRVGLSEQASSPFQARWCWNYDREGPLDAEAMDRAARAIPGDHSFLAFAKAGQEHRGDRCIVSEAYWTEWPELGLEFRISANRFLHHMVRYLVGTMVEIGAGRRPVEDIERMLQGEGGPETSPPAPPQGLFLEAVEYAVAGRDAGSTNAVRGTKANSIPSTT